MGILVLNEAEQRAKEIVAFAEKSENWYRVGESTWIPGDRPEYVLLSGTVRAVFSYTMVRKDLYRYMTVSAAPGRMPNPTIVWTLAYMFGFTGAEPVEGVVTKPSTTWAYGADDTQHYVIVQETVQA